MDEEHQVERQHMFRERALAFVKSLLPRRGPTEAQVRRAIQISFLLIVLLSILMLIGLPLEVTLLDWLKLLIVPVAIAGAGVWFNQQHQERQLRIEDQRSQDEALQTYLERIGGLLTDKGLRKEQDNHDLRTLARAYTLTLLARLGPDRKRNVMQFLYEAGLINQDDPVINLEEANLRDAKLIRIKLVSERISSPAFEEAFERYGKLPEDLTRARNEATEITGFANMSGVDLSDAKLEGADLRGVDLSFANLYKAHLQGANLYRANLYGANLYEANLYGANLQEANLYGVRFQKSNLQEANLHGAAGVTAEQIWASIGSATTQMPEGIPRPASWAHTDQ